MKKVLLLHGWGGKKEQHWLTWLEAELKLHNIEVFFPKIPNSYNPKLSKWLEHLHPYIQDFQPDIVVAHSLGALCWWHYQFKYKYILEKIISVSPPTFSSFPSKTDTFFPLPHMRFEPNTHHVICSLNDKNIELTKLKELSIEMNFTLHLKETGEHLDHFSHTTKLPEILEILGL